ncbi:hypothetical protein PAXRUDRAFT_28248 [Paxillus rubicundulus Ve08.2h10]|uniref:Thioester reductase (TE) domain-containing protein n=1 Tax=Paxillus rubicundulus Ve08.2h10 TaxID=930991 RepID=A0A0D0CX10_9AGAM|nr:hypothetical protein PAXRUDRAFT_28248 [Paxillus rubicundulus Ve08.2h10]
MPDKKDIADGDWLWMRFADNVRWVSQGHDIMNARYRICGKWSSPSLASRSRGPVQHSPTSVGRTDDAITLTSGEKRAPALKEHIIGSSPLLDGVIMFGQERGQVGTLIEPKSDINPDTNISAQGSDSLSVTHLRNQLLNTIRGSQDANIRSAVSCIPLNIVFENPIIKDLAARVASLVSEGGESQTLDTKEQHIVAMNAMTEKYTIDLNGPENGAGIDDTMNGATHISRAVVLLTGSTGGLGSFLLSRLLENSSVERVYALNRPSSSTPIAERQRSAFLDRGLPVDLLNSCKLVYVEADTLQDQRGLSSALYDEELYQRSLSAVPLGSPEGAVPWKYSSTRLLLLELGMGRLNMFQNGGFHATSLRIGQIAGGPNGSWATADWVPILFKCRIALGALPNAYGFVSWLRLEEVAASALYVAFATATLPALNVVNPRGHIMLVLSEDLLTIPFKDWFARLRKKVECESLEDLVDIWMPDVVFCQPEIKLPASFHSISHTDEGARTHATAKMVAHGINIGSPRDIYDLWCSFFAAIPGTSRNFEMFSGAVRASGTCRQKIDEGAFLPQRSGHPTNKQPVGLDGRRGRSLTQTGYCLHSKYGVKYARRPYIITI